MDKTDVVWLSYHDDILARGYWDQGILEDIFKQGQYEHHTSANDLKGGAVVIINGRTHVDDVDLINHEIKKLKWVLFIETGDEEASFPWRDVKHPLMKVWMMLPRMNKHDDVHYKLVNGYRPQTHDWLTKVGIKTRELDYFFAGQINHERREQCADVLDQFKSVYKSVVVRTNGFGKEIVPYDQYLKNLSVTKIVPCPSGIESPDNFRLYEALEAGCVPVVDAFSTKFKTPGFWRYLLGDDIPFPIIDYWDAFPKILPGLLADYPANANRCFSWWQLKKREIKYRLLDDIKELSK